MFATALLFNPDGYFDGQEFGFGIPAALLGGIAVCSALAGGIRLLATAEALDGPGSQTALLLVGLPSMVAGAFTPFVVCLVYAVTIYALARYFGGTGSFRRTVWSVGYGFLPGLLGSVVLVGATALAVSAVPPPETVDGITPFMRRVNAHTAYRFGATLNLVTIVWSGFIWTFATKHVHDVDEADAAVVVGVPVVLSLAVALLGVL